MKNPNINGSFSDVLLRVLSGATRVAGSNKPVKRPARQGAPSCESLEGRVVLSNFGGADLLGGLSQIGVVTSVMDAEGPHGGHDSQADTAWQTLQTEIQALAAKSDVTIADLSALASDSRAIATAGGGLKTDGLRTVLGSLAAAVAGGADTTQAQADFNALFSGSKVDQATIDKTFADLVQTIKDSNITTSDLTAFAAAVSALPNGGDRMHAPGFPGAPGQFHDGGPGGDALTASLANAGVMAPPTAQKTTDTPWTAAGSTSSGPVGGTSSDQLQIDLAKLRTDQQAVTAKSTVSSVDLDQLKTDSQNIMAAGFHFDPKTLQSTISSLVTAVAGRADTTQAQADFNALFSGSKVDQATIDKTFADLVQTIKDSNITADDASLIAADQAAVQADFAAMPQGGMPGDNRGGGFGGPGGMDGGLNHQGGGAAITDHVTGLSVNPGSTAGSTGATTAVPATSSDPVASQIVSSNPGTAANSTATVSTIVGGRVRGGARGFFTRTVKGGTVHGTAGGPQVGQNTTGVSAVGGVQSRATRMTQHGGVLNRIRHR